MSKLAKLGSPGFGHLLSLARFGGAGGQSARGFKHLEITIITAEHGNLVAMEKLRRTSIHRMKHVADEGHVLALQALVLIFTFKPSEELPCSTKFNSVKLLAWRG